MKPFLSFSIRVLLGGLLISQFACTSIIQATRLQRPTATSFDSEISVNTSDQRSIHPLAVIKEGQRVYASAPFAPVNPAPTGHQWVFVVKDNNPNGQFEGYWMVVPIGYVANSANPIFLSQ